MLLYYLIISAGSCDTSMQSAGRLLKIAHVLRVAIGLEVYMRNKFSAISNTHCLATAVTTGTKQD
jgi:hypothetical protein